jgi:hypothetical protein
MYGLPDSFLGNTARKLIRRSLRGGGGPPGGPGRRRSVVVWKVINVKIYKPQLNLILNTPRGNLWGALHRRGESIVRGAKRQVGVRTGALRTSIHMKHTGNFTGQYLWIGSNKNYAYAHHEGTRPHLITPSKKPVLVFRTGTRLIRTTEVFHPGTRANPYLTTPMRKSLIRPIKVR